MLRSEVRSQKSEIRSPKSEVRSPRCQAMANEPNKRVKSAKDPDVYKLAYELAMTIFRISQGFPPEERFALTTQIRRSSRSVCLNLREAWAKRRYEAHFVSKLTDCENRLIGGFCQRLSIYLRSRASGVDRQVRRAWANAWTDNEEVTVVFNRGIS